ncbi:hypothetical protein BMS3Abin13_01407 [bacterium BMS3Abin13]|nr:hypothetical protein BMS3Abin13_01407 [bacterium BMS3Abin13]
MVPPAAGIAPEMGPDAVTAQHDQADQVVDVNPFEAVGRNGQKNIVEPPADERNREGEMFGYGAGRRTGGIIAQDITGKEQQQRYGHAQR